MEGSDLEARLRRLEDLEAIRELRFLYHERINAREFDRMSELFTDDAHVRLVYVWRGREEIDRGFRSIEERVEFIEQFPHNHRIILDGDRAEGRCYLEARNVRSGVNLMLSGEYRDDYARIDGRWLFQRIDFLPAYSVPVPMPWTGEGSRTVKQVEG